MVVLCTALLILLVSTSPTTAERCLSTPEVNPKRFLNFEGQTLDLRLEVSRRITHQLMTHVVYIFLQEVLGYPYVSISQHEDHFNASEAFERLSGPSAKNVSPVPESMVNLEVWIPPELNTLPLTSTNHVRECGIIAPPGRFGWFVPKNLSHIIPAMDHWRIFLQPKTAQVFAMKRSELLRLRSNFAKDSATGKFYCEESFCEEGMFTPDRCRNIDSCALLLTGYSDETRFVAAHIEALGLYVQVLWVGPNLIVQTAQLTARYEADGTNALVVLSWTPSALTTPGDNLFTTVTFPPCETFSRTDCKYDMHRLVKLSWSKLQVAGRPAFEAINKVEFTSEDIEELLRHYRAESARSMTQLACHWMRDNRHKWIHWEPGDEDKNVLFIGGIFPISRSDYTAKGTVIASKMAKDAVNANSSLLRDYEIQLLVADGQCRADMVMKTFIDYILVNQYTKLAGVLGPACSETVEPLAGVSKHFKTIVISYSAEGSSFSDRTKYPYFFRTIGENKQYKFVYLQLLEKLGWHRVASLTEDGQKYTEYISHMQDLLHKNGITFVANRKFPQDWTKDQMNQYLSELKGKNARILIADVNDVAARAVMCEAYHLGMTAMQGYTWFLPLWLSPHWYNTDQYNAMNNETTPCTTQQMIQSINGFLAMTHAYFAPDDEIMQEGITVKEWRRNYNKTCNNQKEKIELSDVAGYAYDAVWTYALALDTLMRENQSYLSDLHSTNTTNRFVDVISKTNFNGVSGHIQFHGGPSRLSVINVYQWINHSKALVGVFTPNRTNAHKEIEGGTLELYFDKIVWLNPDGTKPWDGTEKPPHCYLSWLAEFLDESCELAFFVANVIGLVFFGSIIIIAFIIIKRRYDKKVKLTEKYMKSLGIDLLSASSMGSLDKWEIPRDRVVINRKLGEGAFGMVYGGEAYFNEKGWVAVAVKTLKVGSTTEEKLDFLSEAEVMKRFEHKNIVKLLGVCTKNEPVYTVMEFMLYGDLKTFLLARRHLVNERGMTEESDEISSKKLTTMALDIARALSYLAQLKYIHRDVASRNCLINVTRVVKLGDFGMTRPMFENDYYKFNRKGMLPVRWMAPESLGLGVFTPSSDVWSFGVLLYEVITFGSFPFQGLSNNQVLEHVKAGNTLTIPSGVKPQLEGLIRSCWNLDYKKRPKASEIVEFLANNPRLLAPCLDVPLSSVQMEDTGQLEIVLPEKLRKFSVSLLRQSSVSGKSWGSPAPPLLGDMGAEPLLGRGDIDMAPPQHSKYVMLQPAPSSQDSML